MSLKGSFRMKKFLFLISFMAMSSLIFACSKDDSASSSSSSFFSFFKSEKAECFLNSSPFTKKITQDSPLFAIWDTTNSEYKDLIKKYPLSFNESTLTNLIKNDKTVQKNIKLLEKIFDTQKLDASSVISKGVLFFEEIKEGSFPMAIFMELEQEINQKELYSTLKDVAKKNGLESLDISLNGQSGVSITSKDGTKEFTMNFLTKGKQIAISNRTYLLERFLSNDFDSGYMKKLFDEDSSFKKSYEKASQKDATTIFTASLILNSKFLPDKKVQSELSKLAVKNIVMNQSIVDKKVLLNKFASSYDPQSDGQEKIKTVLSGIKKTNAPFDLPNETFASVTFNVDLIKNLFEIFGKEKTLDKFQSVIDMNSLNITLQSPRGSLFPNIALVGTNVKNADTITNDIKTLFSNTASGGFLSAKNWQTKKVEKLDTEYIMTPMGVGIFLTKNNSNVIIASSENLLVELLQDKSKEEAKKLRKKFNTNENDIFNVYFSPKFFASTLRMLAPTLSSFMKSEAAKINETIAVLESTPDSMLDVFYEDDVIVGETKIIFE